METIDIGSGLNAGDGESVRSAMNKINQNFQELNQTKKNNLEVDFDIIGVAPNISVDDFSEYTEGYWNITADSTFSLVVNNGRALTLFIRKNSFVLNFPNNITWLAGTAPTLQSTGYNVIKLFASRNVVYGSLLGNVPIPTP